MQEEEEDVVVVVVVVVVEEETARLTRETEMVSDSPLTLGASKSLGLFTLRVNFSLPASPWSR